MIFPFHSFAILIASATVDSETCFAAASIMTVFLLVPDTTKSSSRNCPSGLRGFTTISFPPLSPTIPTLIVLIGPFHGIFEIDKAAEVAILASISGSFSPSTESTLIITWISFFSSFGKSGLIDLSIRRAVKIASSVGLPSLFTHLLPFIRPPAYNLSTYSTLNGK